MDRTKNDSLKYSTIVPAAEGSKYTGNNTKSKRISKNTSNSYLRVRSNNSRGFMKLNKTESRALDDPNESFDFFYKLIVIGDE
jgi:hypothetical protein